MRVVRHSEGLTLTFNVLEGRILQRVLNAILHLYNTKPGQMHPKVAAAWYSTRGCEAAGMSAEETSQWIENLHRDRSSRRALLEEWARQVAIPSSQHSQLRVSHEQASDLMMALNDHRLMLAARYDIGQTEMDLHSLQAVARLKSAEQVALHEIHFLAWIIEEILRALSQGE